jgi:hypothetical protein
MKFIYIIIVIILCISCGRKVENNNSKTINENEIVLPISNLNKVKTEEIFDEINIAEQINFKNLPIDEFLTSLKWYRGLYSGGYSIILGFTSDGIYSLFMTRGLGVYATGAYEILNENEVLLKYPVEFPRGITNVVSESIDNIFGNKDLLLKLDREYIDFYNMYKLFSEKELYVSEVSSPAGNEYVIDNASALKKKGRVKILDIVNTRREPSINAPLAGYNFMYRFFREPDILVNFVVFGEEFEYEAISTNIDEIDTYKKPWYRIVVEMEEYRFSTWVYGGYVDEILEFNYNIDYMEIQNKIIRELVNRGYNTKIFLEE